jgi:hypothetical protein
MGNQRVEMHYAFRQWGNNVDTTDNASGVWYYKCCTDETMSEAVEHVYYVYNITYEITWRRKLFPVLSPFMTSIKNEKKNKEY